MAYGYLLSMCDIQNKNKEFGNSPWGEKHNKKVTTFFLFSVTFLMKWRVILCPHRPTLPLHFNILQKEFTQSYIHHNVISITKLYVIVICDLLCFCRVNLKLHSRKLLYACKAICDCKKYIKSHKNH